MSSDPLSIDLGALRRLMREVRESAEVSETELAVGLLRCVRVTGAVRTPEQAAKDLEVLFPEAVSLSEKSVGMTPKYIEKGTDEEVLAEVSSTMRGKWIAENCQAALCIGVFNDESKVNVLVAARTPGEYINLVAQAAVEWAVSALSTVAKGRGERPNDDEEEAREAGSGNPDEGSGE